MEVSTKELNELLKSDMPVIVEFWGSWCPPCQRMKTIMDKLEKEYDKQVKIAKINIDRNPEISKKFNISGVPTYIVFQNGELIYRDVGAKSEKQLGSMLEKVI